METSSVSSTSTAYNYTPAVSSSSDSGDDFAALLSSQLTDNETASGANATSSGEEALNAYNAGQVTAYNLESEETASGEEAAATEETADSGEKPGYPAEVGQEWTPKGMQFYDTTFNRWVDDDIPHRFNENGDLEYCYEGEWYLDVAVRHRMVYTNGEEEMAVEVSEGTESATAEGETAETADLAAASDEEEVASFSLDEYYNEVLGTWKIFNLPTRTNEDGEREYYWGDSWRADTWEHRTAAA